MKKVFLAACICLLSLSSFAQTIIKGVRTNEGVDLCFYKQVELKGYAYANLIGKCAWDPAMNGMNLSIVVVGENQVAYRVPVEYVRDVVAVENRAGQVLIKVVQDNFDANDNVIQTKKVIQIKGVNDSGTVSILVK